jgi:hypothetical protein
MPGRPRTTLKRLNELNHRAESYLTDLLALMPDRYKERENSNDPICIAWRQAAGAAVESCQTLRVLRELVAEKAMRAEQLKAIMEGGGEEDL